MIESEGILGDLHVAISQAIFLTGKEVLKRGLKKGITLAKNAAPGLAENATEYYVNKGINKLNKNFRFRNNSNKQ